MNTIHSDYYTTVLGTPTHLSDAIARSVLALQDILDDFDAIVVTGVSGVSGLLVGTAVAATLQKQIVAVRKTRDNSHAETLTEGLPGADFRYVILDDFTCSGDTLRAIRKAMPTYATDVGTYLYTRSGEFVPPKQKLEFTIKDQIEATNDQNTTNDTSSRTAFDMFLGRLQAGSHTQ